MGIALRNGARLLCFASGFVLATACTETKSPVGPHSNSAGLPVITAITPQEAVAGLPELGIRITGLNFVDAAPELTTLAVWTGATTRVLNTTFVSSTEVTAIVPASALAKPGTATVYVVNGDVMGIGDGTRYPTSNSVTFRIIDRGIAELSGSYLATFEASASCASVLPLSVRERTYTAMIRPDGRIDWSGPSLQPPPGHWPISSATLKDDLFSFSIDVDRDPQSDDFHGLWDILEGGEFLTIAGKGRGELHGGEIAGALSGSIAFFTSSLEGHYCLATDHEFRLVRQP